MARQHRDDRPADPPAPRVSEEMIEELRLILERKTGRPIDYEYAAESARNLLGFGRLLMQWGAEEAERKRAEEASGVTGASGGPEVAE